MGVKIDLAEAPQLVKDLEEYVRRMEATALRLNRLAQVQSAGHDDYSAMIAGDYQGAADAHLKQNRAAQAWARGMIDSINASMQSYKATEENNRMRS
jgi:hypothetical protein